MANETPQPLPGDRTDALDSILVIIEGREDNTVRPTRLKQALESYPRLPGKAPQEGPADQKEE